ncbi:slipin family protein [Neobacillus vireti]|uniref:slipin family protein n=1 Tax=Neobacillus vireti TaxID=220686 RepID=UPI002FFF46B4
MFDIMMVASLIILIFILFILIKRLIKTVTIFQYESGIKFYKGKFKEVIGPGKYTYFTSTTHLEVFDQELLTADNVSVKISLAVKYQILDPQALISEYQNFQESLYMSVQFKLREVISSIEMDELLKSRQKINDEVRNLLLEDRSLVGFSIHTVDLKDIMFSAELKKVYSEVLKAKKEALSLLEKARGETATLRSLANTAKILENNPELAQLRLIQTIEASQGNTFIIDILNSSKK